MNIVKEIEQEELISHKHTKVCTTLNYIENCLILASTVNVYISFFAFGILLSYLVFIFTNP